MTKTIADYTAAVSIDPANDFMLIEPNGNTVYNKINRNVLLGISGSPVGTSDSQVLTNKTIGNTNTVTLKDTLFTLQDDGDTTKQAVFQLSGITTATTRTYTMPNASTTLVGTDNTATLTNKTLTSPTITGGTIDNTTITVDSIAGHSTSTIVTVANLQISNGVLNSANAVTATSIAAGAVQPQALVTGTGSGWAWQTWSPTYANLTVGNGTVTSKYIQIGKSVFFIYKIIFGTTSSMGTNPTISFPVTTNASYISNDMLGNGFANTSTSNNPLWVQWVSSTTFNPTVFQATGTYVASQTLFTSAIPGTWANGSQLTMQGFYEAA